MSKKTGKILFSIIIAGIIFTGGVFTGQNFTSGDNSSTKNSLNLPDMISAGKIPVISSTEPKDVDFSLLWEAWKVVDTEYIDKADKHKRVEGAIQGMLQSLGDPYTVYFEPTTNQRFLDDLEGHFDGIGAELSIRDAVLTVVAPLENSPAEKAGIKAKDIIIKVDGKATSEMTFNEAIMKIRGKKGTKVVLTILHDGQNEETEISVIRDTIEVKSVKLEYVGQNKSVAVIKINQFGSDTLSLLESSAREIKSKNAQAVIVDLRNNPGGLLETAVNVISLFLPNDLSAYSTDSLKRGVTVIQKGKDTKNEELLRTKKQMFDLPMVVIQNKGSASASEIFAGAIKDYGLGKIIGETSFGKGSVQNLAELSNKGSVKITIAKWYTPLDRTINGTGIEPDIIVKEEAKDGNDPQINKAIEILNIK